jgi:hypothetical protein
MEQVIEVSDGIEVIARLIPSSVAWTEGLNFFSRNDDYVQVGVWRYEMGTVLAAHTHNKAPREINYTQEVIFVRKGKLVASIYNSNGEEKAELVVNEGDILILLGGGHGYQIIESDTQVLEVKNGPYLGPTIDRRRL